METKVIGLNKESIKDEIMERFVTVLKEADGITDELGYRYYVHEVEQEKAEFEALLLLLIGGESNAR